MISACDITIYHCMFPVYHGQKLGCDCSSLDVVLGIHSLWLLQWHRRNWGRRSRVKNITWYSTAWSFSFVCSLQYMREAALQGMGMWFSYWIGLSTKLDCFICTTVKIIQNVPTLNIPALIELYLPKVLRLFENHGLTFSTVLQLNTQSSTKDWHGWAWFT